MGRRGSRLVHDPDQQLFVDSTSLPGNRLPDISQVTFRFFRPGFDDGLLS
jgi:hypothetical protein